MQEVVISNRWLRRSFLKAAATAAALPVAPAVWAQKPLKKVTIAWSATAICTVPVPAALKQGYFREQGLDVSFINFAGSTDQLLEAIATGHANAGVGMALRWLKPLEQGFDVKLVSGVMSGCIRLLAAKDSGVGSLAQLKGKAIGVSDMASPSKNLFAILLAKQGIDPDREVTWKVFPADLLGESLKKGEVQAVADNDPVISTIRKNYGLQEIASNMSGEFAHRSCCVLAVSGNMARTDRTTAAGLVKAIAAGSEWTANHPREAAEIFASYAPKSNLDDLVAMLRGQSHHHHPIDTSFKQEIQAYADDLKLIHVMNASTNSQKFADGVYANVLG